MSEYQISSLQSVANKILDALHTHSKMVAESLEHVRELPNLIRGLGKIINDGFDRQIQASGETVILGKVANVSSKRSLVEAETQAIEEFRKQLEEDSKEIEERYGKIQRDLNDDARTRVEELDEHLLNLYKTHFLVPPKGVFGQATEAMLSVFLQDSVRHLAHRSGAVGRALEDARKEIVSFVGNRSRFFGTLHKYSQTRPDATLSTYHMPVMIVVTTSELEGKKGHREVPLAGATARSSAIELLLSGDAGTTLEGRLAWHPSDEFKEMIKKRVEHHVTTGKREEWMVRPLHQIIDASPLETVMEGQS